MRRRRSTKTKKVEAASKGYAKAIVEAMREEERKARKLMGAAAEESDEDRRFASTHERDQQAAGSEVPGLSACLLDGEPTEFRIQSERMEANICQLIPPSPSIPAAAAKVIGSLLFGSSPLPTRMARTR